ncbi:MAG: hypothetical protein AAFU70_01955, partial [Planctomycetota bacterium]
MGAVDTDASATINETGHVTLGMDMSKHDPHETRWGDFLKATIRFEASDLICKTDQPPALRLKGSLKRLDTAPITLDEWRQIINHILTEEQKADLHKFGSVDFAYDYDEKTRVRVNLFQARGKISVAARRITSKILPFEGLYLPPIMGDIAMQPQGIVLLCGVTGSGKSTTI